MAIATEEISIINEALNLLGVKRTTAAKVASPSAAGYDAVAEIAAESYEKHRDALLRDHPWNFAVQRKILTVNVTAPPFGYSYAFDLPAGTDPLLCLRVLEINNEQVYVWDLGGWSEVRKTKNWTIEGRQILCNVADDLEIRYVGRVTTLATMDVLFQDALALKLAAAWAATLSTKNATEFAAPLAAMLNESRSVDGQEDVLTQLYTSEWDAARY